MKRLPAIITGLIISMMLSVPLMAATGTNIKDLNGLGAGVATALSYAKDAASGVATLNSSGQLTKNTTGNAATASAVPATGVTGTTLAPNVVNSSLTTVALGTLGTGAVNPAPLPISSAVPVTDNATFKASGSGVVAVPHPTAPTYTANHTFTSADLNTLSPINAASSAAITMTLDTTTGAVEGDQACFGQGGAGKVTLAAASGVNVISASGYMSIGAQSGVACVKKGPADNSWWFVGNRGN